jgi:serine/threonine protein kinase
MGVVYKARDTRLARLAAIKVLSSTTADEASRRRFAQEARAAPALNHPGIITIYDIANDQNVDFIAMEFVQGTTLEGLIERKALPLRAARARTRAGGLRNRSDRPVLGGRARRTLIATWPSRPRR